MEELKTAKAHKVLLANRKSANFSGVLDVLSFDVNEILLETEYHLESIFMLIQI